MNRLFCIFILLMQPCATVWAAEPSLISQVERRLRNSEGVRLEKLNFYPRHHIWFRSLFLVSTLPRGNAFGTSE